MNYYQLNSLSETELDRLCRRPKMDEGATFDQVRSIIEDIKSGGNTSLAAYTEKYDGVRPEPLAVDPQNISVTLEDDVREAIDTAFENIFRFHKAQLPVPIEVETIPGVRCMRVSRPIERVGLYVPGGTAMLPSTLMMLGIPAALAGCKQIVVATPPVKDGTVADEIMYIAQRIGAGCVLKAGGAQAIAAMAYGTETVPKADKLFGPGNQYVTAAKMLLQNSDAQIAIDMPAGPSEVLIIADGSADPAFVAADLLSQAEHGPDSQTVLVYAPGFDLPACTRELEQQLSSLPRQKIARKAIDNSFCLETETLDEAFAFSNRYAPEHLIVQCKDAEAWQDCIQHAGSVFLGQWSPESVGDYASGTNHTLPTYGYARMYSGVSVNSFCKFITMQQLSQEGIRQLGPTVETLACLEKLEGHKRAVSLRLEKLQKSPPKPAPNSSGEGD